MKKHTLRVFLLSIFMVMTALGLPLCDQSGDENGNKTFLFKADWLMTRVENDSLYYGPTVFTGEIPYNVPIDAPVYACFTKDSDGFAKLVKVYAAPPRHTKHYMKTYSYSGHRREIFANFTPYPVYLGPEAAKQCSALIGGRAPVFLEAEIKKGKGIIKNVYINGEKVKLPGASAQTGESQQKEQVPAILKKLAGRIFYLDVDPVWPCAVTDNSLKLSGPDSVFQLTENILPDQPVFAHLKHSGLGHPDKITHITSEKPTDTTDFITVTKYQQTPGGVKIHPVPDYELGEKKAWLIKQLLLHAGPVPAKLEIRANNGVCVVEKVFLADNLLSNLIENEAELQRRAKSCPFFVFKAFPIAADSIDSDWFKLMLCPHIVSAAKRKDQNKPINYASFEAGPDGFAVVAGLHEHKPKNVPCLPVKHHEYSVSGSEIILSFDVQKTLLYPYVAEVFKKKLSEIGAVPIEVVMGFGPYHTFIYYVKVKGQYLTEFMQNPVPVPQEEPSGTDTAVVYVTFEPGPNGTPAITGTYKSPPRGGTAPYMPVAVCKNPPKVKIVGSSGTQTEKSLPADSSKTTPKQSTAKSSTGETVDKPRQPGTEKKENNMLRFMTDFLWPSSINGDYLEFKVVRGTYDGMEELAQSIKLSKPVYACFKQASTGHKEVSRVSASKPVGTNNYLKITDYGIVHDETGDVLVLTVPIPAYKLTRRQKESLRDVFYRHAPIQSTVYVEVNNGSCTLQKVTIRGSLLEEILKAPKSRGASFVFKTQPLDPDRAVSGGEIRFKIKPQVVSLAKNRDFGIDAQEVYATLETGSDGMAVIAGLSSTRPSNTNDYLRIYDYCFSDSGSEITINFPFRTHSLGDGGYKGFLLKRWLERMGPVPAEVKVRVFKGRGVVEYLMFNGQAVIDLLDAERELLEKEP